MYGILPLAGFGNFLVGTLQKTANQMTRIPYSNEVHLLPGDALLIRKRGGERRLLAKDWWINRNTPVGEDAELWERKPFNGRRSICRAEIIAIERFP